MVASYMQTKRPRISSRGGEVTASYQALVRLLGDPNYGESPDGKVKAEWWVASPEGKTIGLWDYCTGRAPEDNLRWSVDADPEDVRLLQARLMALED